MVCIVVLISRGLSIQVLTHYVVERDGQGFGELVCVYVLHWFLYATEGTLYPSPNYFRSPSNNCTCTRSIGGPFVRITDQIRVKFPMKGSPWVPDEAKTRFYSED